MIAYLLKQAVSYQLQFSSVQNSIYVLGKAHMRSTPSLRGFPNVAFETSNVRLIDADPLSSFQGRSSSASSFHASLFQAFDSVMSSALYPQVVSSSSTLQSFCEGCFARQSICSVISLHSGMSRAVHPQSFGRWMSSLNRHIPVWSFHSTFPITRVTITIKCPAQYLAYLLT